jgi:hypothetical protein
MTGTDLIVLAPWVVFAVALAIICLLLLRAPGPRRARRSAQTSRDPADPDPQEARCPEKNAEARP